MFYHQVRYSCQTLFCGDSYMGSTVRQSFAAFIETTLPGTSFLCFFFFLPRYKIEDTPPHTVFELFQNHF